MNRKLRPTRSTQQIKGKQINFLLKDVEKNLEECKKAIELKDKQLPDTKKILHGPKKSYDTLVNKNAELKKYVENIKQRYEQYQNQQHQEYFHSEREYFRQKQSRKHLKVIYEEESDSEPEIEESQYVPEEKEEIKEPKREPAQKRKNNIFDYLNNDAKEISDKVFLWNTVSPYDNIGRLSAINRTASNYNDAKEKVKEIRELISAGGYDEDIVKYIPGLLELKFQGMLEDIDTREKVAHPSYTDMEQLNFQILLTDNYYINPNSIHICFPMKIKKKTNQNLDIDADLITVTNFFAHFVKEISITKYASNKELIPTFSLYETYQYSDAMLKHLLMDALKTIEKTHLYSKQPVNYNDVTIDRRTHNGDGITTTGMNATQIATTKKITPRT